MLWGRRALVYNQCQRYYTASYGSCILSTSFSYHNTVFGDGGGGALLPLQAIMGSFHLLDLYR